MEVTSLETLLFNYQQTIKKLLTMRICDGLSLQELERFKQDFKTAAFTCRLWSCPRATVGFDNDDLRLAHEASHQRILCNIPGCQYPPFPSNRSLEEHYANCHGEEVTSLKRTAINADPALIPSSMQNDTPHSTINLRSRHVPKPPQRDELAESDQALEDYQMQLMLLGQQNKKRLETERERQPKRYGTRSGYG